MNSHTNWLMLYVTVFDSVNLRLAFVLYCLYYISIATTNMLHDFHYYNWSGNFLLLSEYTYPLSLC